MKQSVLKDHSDQELLEQFYQLHDPDCLGELLRRYTILLMGLCMKYFKNQEQARDAVQQVFLKVLTELPKTKVVFFKSWLYMVTKNHCLMELRKSHHLVNLEESDHTIPAEESELDIIIEKEKNLTLLRQSIGSLNKEQQVCITLFYLQNKSYEEIANLTGYTMMQVKSYIQNGKRNLRILIEKQQQPK